MAIIATGGKLHWNYLLALDRDMEAVSRYIEFTTANENVYSIELAHLLFAAASEVDVVAKLVCEQVDPTARRANIDDYRSILASHLPHLADTAVHVPRYGMSFRPWENWATGRNPDWWRSYNNVKHERDRYFQEATLQHALNSLGALLLLCFRHYSRSLGVSVNTMAHPREVTRQLSPATSLIRFDEGWYDDVVIV